MKKARTNRSQVHSSKQTKGSGDWHASGKPQGVGDYYGTGVKAKIGRIREGIGMKPLGSKKLKTPPKSVV